MLVAVVAVFFSFTLDVKAQSSLSLSVSPTIFDMSANPTQDWSSSVRVINSNPYEIKVFADVVNFAPKGERGQGKFLPVIDTETQGQTVAEWVDITKEAIVIPPEQTVEVPFSIKVPETAPPGGHFAALLIGTKPPEGVEGMIGVETSQVVTTLLFLKVTGDVIEDGSIRSFRTEKSLVEKPEATFELRFENKGNVHLLPRGDIKILNMWGQERGLIPINSTTMFGTVLPDSVRNYSFTWKGEWSLADMGRYTAIATLGYGEEQKQFSSSKIAFWVIPFKALGLVLLILIGFIAFFTWVVKLYIRKMLSMAGVAPGQHPVTSSARRVSVVAPIEEGMLDLRGQWQQTTTWKERSDTLLDFLKKNRIFFFGVLVLVLFIGGISWYINSASQSERPYDVTIDGLSEDLHISSDEVKYQQKKEEESGVSSTEVVVNRDLPKIIIVNRSGVNGLAVDLRLRLEKEGYEILDMQNDLGAAEENTVIVYNPVYTDEALALSQKIYGALLSAFAGQTDSEAPITVYVGRDLENAVQ